MPRSLWFKVFVVLAALWAPFSQADTGWQPIQETIRKSEKDTRQYQAIRLDNDMVVLLVSDPQAVKSLSALVVPVGSLQDPADHQGLAHFLEHMTLMGSQKYPQPDSLAEFLKLHGAHGLESGKSGCPPASHHAGYPPRLRAVRRRSEADQLRARREYRRFREGCGCYAGPGRDLTSPNSIPAAARRDASHDVIVITTFPRC